MKMRRWTAWCLLLCAIYYIYMEDGALWVRRDGEAPRQAAYCCPQALPAADRAALEAGLTAGSLPELTEILENFCS